MKIEVNRVGAGAAWNRNCRSAQFRIVRPQRVWISEIIVGVTIRDGDLSQYTIVSNRNVVRIKLRNDALPKYEGKISKNLKESDEYHASFLE